MATLGTTGANRNFTAAFTVPAGQTLVGYLRDTFTGAKYSALDVLVAVPAAKAAAVKAVLLASSPRYHLLPGNAIPYTGAITFRGFRIRWRNGSKTAAEITTLLAAVDTAITT